MNIKLFVIGNKFDKFCYEGIKEYEKRLSRYGKFKIEQFKDQEQLNRKLSSKTYKIGITISKDVCSSEQLAEQIDMLGTAGKSDITFILGNSSLELNQTISITPMYIELGIQALIFTEQIYRAYRIIQNEPYHK
ncbi:23S rRNA (pseudouridine(1915)-N(3))-methyltransferase RlmH [Lysinibacillus capsici]|uniref:23S rRNA (pseudouridine(1915)-N(3))-methyltransferase RlmH n=1 Tax=Lysinibacillus capsici TaxID=2115968 RepID=UPI003F245887